MGHAVKVAIVCLFLCGAVLYAQQSVSPKPEESKYTEIKYWADNYSYRWQGDDKIMVLKGNVKFVQGDTTFLADVVEYHESTRTAVSSGNLKIFDPQNTITGKQCNANFREKKATIVGDVHIIAKPKPDKTGKSKMKKEWKDEVDVTCSTLDYYYKEKKAVIPTTVTIVQKGRIVTADSATYTEKDQMVELVGNVKGHDEDDKHSFMSPRVRVSLKDDDEWVEAQKASGTIYVKDEEESKPETPKTK